MAHIRTLRPAHLWAYRRPLEVTAARELDAPRRRLFSFLAEPANHRLLTSEKLQLIELSEDAGPAIMGVMMLRGPLGLRRRAEIWTTTWRPLEYIGGSALLGRSTSVEVSWHLLPTINGTTKVALRASIVEAGAVDRLLLALGGAAWTERLFRDTLLVLASETEAPAGADAREQRPAC